VAATTIEDVGITVGMVMIVEFSTIVLATVVYEVLSL